jgi:hypothetical protein
VELRDAALRDTHVVGVEFAHGNSVHVSHDLCDVLRNGDGDGDAHVDNDGLGHGLGVRDCERAAHAHCNSELNGFSVRDGLVDALGSVNCKCESDGLVDSERCHDGLVDCVGNDVSDVNRVSHCGCNKERVVFVYVFSDVHGHIDNECVH